jgi:hypothetical protein
MMHRVALLLLLVTATLYLVTPTPCTVDSECHDLQGIESTCGSDGLCSNPFESGCLYARLPGWEKKRVCNSDDPLDAAKMGVCTEPILDYMEVRIISGNWESITFNAWLMQILLSEILQVPTTLESGLPNISVNLYEESGAFEYGSYDPVTAFENAFQYKDCRLASRSEANYETCAHVQSEFWGAGSLATEYLGKGIIEPLDALGVLAKESMYVNCWDLLCSWFLQDLTACGTYDVG